MKCVGFGVVDNDDDLDCLYSDIEHANSAIDRTDKLFPEYSPHRVVRVLIDEIEDELQESNKA